MNGFTQNYGNFSSVTSGMGEVLRCIRNETKAGVKHGNVGVTVSYECIKKGILTNRLWPLLSDRFVLKSQVHGKMGN